MLANIALCSPFFLIAFGMEYGPRISRFLENRRLDNEQYGDWK